MKNLPEKVALVTGSTRGIGAAIARALNQLGVSTVINSYQSIDEGKQLAKQLNNSLYCQANIANESDCQRLIKTIIEHYGRLDILVNNAGLPGKIPNYCLETISNEVFTRMLQANVVGTWGLIREAIPYLKQHNDGVIINITSCAGVDPASVSSAMPYAVSKAAINYMTKLLAKELGPAIRVNAIAPGVIQTARTENFPEALEKFQTRTPLKRIGQAEDIAEMAIALVKSHYTNGEIILVDGGYSTT